ncbi:hypothetical protein [Streptomyces antimycoticus]|nr:hypothetical protein [Streptomyces antimycoticus]
MTIPGIEALDDMGADCPAARTVAPDGDVLLLVPSGSPPPGPPHTPRTTS